MIKGDEPIFIHRRAQAGIDQYGNPTFETQEILIRNALFAYAGSSEPEEINRDNVDTRLTLYLPPGTEVHDGDVFEIRETDWVKDGEIQAWDSPVGLEVGVVVPIRKRRG